MTDSRHATMTTTGAAAVVEYLEEREAAYGLIDHAAMTSARTEADVVGWPNERMGETVVLDDGSGYLLAVIPASERLDMHKLRDVLGAGRQLRLATEEDHLGGSGVSTMQGRSRAR